MPLYEYECRQCGQRFEQIQKFTDPPLERCQSCGGPVSRLISSSAIQFKGTGWYITDYARKGGASADATTGNGKDKKGEKGEAPSGDGKPAAESKSSAKQSKAPAD